VVSLQALYDDTVREGVPGWAWDLLERLDPADGAGGALTERGPDACPPVPSLSIQHRHAPKESVASPDLASAPLSERPYRTVVP
jgi:hypothetical protein